MRTYTQLTHIQRYQIYALLKTSHLQTEIAETIGVHKATISREIRRNRGRRGYRPKQAHQFAIDRQNKASPRIRIEDWAQIEKLIRLDWSPEQISDQLGKKQRLKISHEWIYQYIYKDKWAGGALWKHLRCRKKRRKRYGSHEKRGQIPNRTSIDERPQVVSERSRLGDWEADTIIGKGRKGAIVTLVRSKKPISAYGFGCQAHQRSCQRDDHLLIDWFPGSYHYL